MSKNLSKKILFLFGIFILSVFLSLLKGAVNFSLTELFFKEEGRQILYLRFCRILLATVAGAGLSVSGIVLQAILRNPLAEPYLLGTSSGAGLGAITAIIIGGETLPLPLAAFAGAILSVVLVYNLAREGNKIPVQSLILSGVIISIAFSGIISFLISISPNEALHGLAWWLWGSMQVYNFKLIFMVSAVVFPAIFLIFILSQDLNAISIGEEEAVHLGIETETLKKLLFCITSLIAASLVCVCGIIGFVGLVIPHILRLLVGPNHKTLIPASCLAGAAFMIISDLASRIVFPPLEIPIGIITAIIGTPVFIILLKRKQRIK